MKNQSLTEAKPNNRLAQYLKNERAGRGMSLREVEVATNNEVSNAYLSQLENGKIAKPSPHILYAVAMALDLKYEDLMERAGYLGPPATEDAGKKHGRAATSAIENLTVDEEVELREYLNFVRSRKVK